METHITKNDLLKHGAELATDSFDKEVNINCATFYRIYEEGFEDLLDLLWPQIEEMKKLSMASPPNAIIGNV